MTIIIIFLSGIVFLALISFAAYRDAKMAKELFSKEKELNEKVLSLLCEIHDKITKNERA
mgnify:CR=1 FL=1